MKVPASTQGAVARGGTQLRRDGALPHLALSAVPDWMKRMMRPSKQSVTAWGAAARGSDVLRRIGIPPNLDLIT